MSSVDPKEIAQFSGHAADWWNPDGALKPLHKLNPARLEYIRDQVCAHYRLKPGAHDIFKNLSVLDIGCGGGLLCEPIARLGAAVTGLDASAEAIEAAKIHAKLVGLNIDYRAGSAEDFARKSPKYDVITALEVLEHVADIDSLLRSISSLLKPGGIAIFSTLNRTPKSYVMSIIAAEYILKWVPRGTHDWRKFIKPSELAAHLAKAGMQVDDITGMIYDPLNDKFHLRAGVVGVNYLMTAIR